MQIPLLAGDKPTAVKNQVQRTIEPLIRQGDECHMYKKITDETRGAK